MSTTWPVPMQSASYVGNPAPMRQPVGQQPSEVALLHVEIAAAVHLPAVHRLTMQASSTAQIVPSAASAWEHPPGSAQLSTVHGLPSSQSVGVGGTGAVQLPNPSHRSPAWQANTSSHDVPAIVGG
jgi:hypothetical protein